MADDDGLVPAARDRGADAVRSRSRREPVVGLRLDLERSRQLASCLARAKQRAGEDRSGSRSFGVELLAERARLLAALRGQLPELVGLPRRGLGVADEVEAHCG